MRIGITGADGFLGWHLRCLLHGDINDVAVPCDQASFADDTALDNGVATSDAIVHFAGINRGTDAEVLNGNIAITDRLIAALRHSGRMPHVLFASSIQIDRDNPYGQAKRICAQHLQAWADSCRARFTAMVLPNVFGEFGCPFYNSVVATFCHQLVHGEEPHIASDAPLELIHAQDAVAQFVALAHEGTAGVVRVKGHDPLLVSEILKRLQELNTSYRSGTFPILADPFDLQLFNTLRSFRFPDSVQGTFEVHTDARGSLWEVARARGAGQTFVSWTLPGITRGNHYHRHKVERFAVLSGSGRIRLRRLFTSDVHTYDLTGEAPGYVDMPTFCTHSIENTGSTPLLTLFWSGELFDAGDPDTWSEPVLVQEARA
ncbi:MAG TPA: NAD-dependent epimerase/dehydratase family protein [Candidatus Deferrimicrobium sp.]|nr:NAD-dependent epimerase/dehydratase family protein [Candidatus Deferrimicrobium sp.]